MYKKALGIFEAQVINQESRINQLTTSTFLAITSGSQDLDNGATNELLTASTDVGGQGEFCRVDPEVARSAQITIEAYRKTLTEDRFATYILTAHYVAGTWYLQEDQVLVLNSSELPELTFNPFTDSVDRLVVMYDSTTIADYDAHDSYIKWKVEKLPSLYSDEPELAELEVPHEIGNLEAWYDFSSVKNLIDLNTFYVLYDRSFNQRHVSQRDNSKRADVAGLFLNSRNVAQFSGGQFYLLGEAISRIMRGRAYSIFILARHTDDDTDGATEGLLTVTERTDPSNDIVGGVYFLDNQVHNVTEDTDQASGAVSIGSFTNIIVASDGTSTDFYIDGVSVGSSTIALDAKVTNNPAIGSFAGLSNFLNGYIAEIQIYSKKLSGSEITDLRNYINSKWGE